MMIAASAVLLRHFFPGRRGGGTPMSRQLKREGNKNATRSLEECLPQIQGRWFLFDRLFSEYLSIDGGFLEKEQGTKDGDRGG